jgi:sarcosine/dimethylglycine N-methyltransferase
VSADAIKSMKLYSGIERVLNDLAEEGFGPRDPVPVELLSRYDQLHYHGTEAVDLAIRTIGITAGSRILEVGSGFGGPARHIAHRTGCRITAVELQPDLNALAADLTARCGLADRVEHIRGDILETALEPGAYDGVVSWLALFHIPDRAPLFPKLAAALKPGGRIHVEDFFRVGSFTPAEQQDFAGMVYGRTLPRRDAYVAEIEAAGLGSVTFEDMTRDWTEFTAGRLEAFRAARPRHLRVHGPEIVAGLEAFYDTMVRLFRGGNLGGVRITARKD